LAIQFEERDLVREHGGTYERYRREVPMLVPFTQSREVEIEAPSSVDPVSVRAGGGTREV
jgi:hypothetical protein